MINTNFRMFFKAPINLIFCTFTFSAFFLSFSASAQKATIQGTVTEDAGPAPFANVFVVGTTIGTTTDFDGKYQFLVEPGTHLRFGF